MPCPCRLPHELGLGLARWLAGDRGQEACVDGVEQLPGSFRYRVAFAPPVLPPDVAVRQLDRHLEQVQHGQHRVHNLRPDAVARQYCDLLDRCHAMSSK